MKFKFRLKWFKAFWRYFRKSSWDLDIWANPSILYIFEHMSPRDQFRAQSMFMRWESLGAPSNQDRRKLTLLVGRKEYIDFGEDYQQAKLRPLKSLMSRNELDRDAVQMSTTELSVPMMQGLVTTFPNIQSLEIELTNQSSPGSAHQVASMLKYWKLTYLNVFLDDGQALRRLIEPINGLTELKRLFIHCTNCLGQPVNLVTLAQLENFRIYTQDNIGVILDSLQNHADGNQLALLLVVNSVDDDHLSQVLQLDSQVARRLKLMNIAAPNKLTSDSLYDLSNRFNQLAFLVINPLPSSISIFQMAASLASLQSLYGLNVFIESLDQVILYCSAMSINSIPQLHTMKWSTIVMKTIRHYVLNEKHLQWIFSNVNQIEYNFYKCATCGYADQDPIDKSVKDK